MPKLPLDRNKNNPPDNRRPLHAVDWPPIEIMARRPIRVIEPMSDEIRRFGSINSY